MAYSSIKPKTGICIDCGRQSRVVAKRCSFCYQKHRSLVSLNKQKENTTSDPGERKLWYEQRVLEMTGQCAECGHYINKNVFKYAVCGVAHILPKSLFPSVEFHPMNWMELGATCGCHGRAEVWSQAVNMRVWPEMVRRFKMFYPLINPAEHGKIPVQLLEQIEKAPSRRNG